MMSEMSVNDLKQMGPILGFSDDLDSPRSLCWSGKTVHTAAATAASGNGLSNNKTTGGIGSNYQSIFGP
jgi:hypothetical protein